MPPSSGRPAAPTWTPPPPPAPRRQGSGAGVAVAVVLVLVAVLVVGGGIGAYLLLSNGNTTGKPNNSSGSGAGRQSSGPGRFDLKKLPQDICGTIDVAPISGQYEAAAGEPTPSRNLNTFAGTASCSISRTHKADFSTASVVSIATVCADLSTGAAVAKQMIDSARLNGDVTELDGIGDQAYTYVDKQQPTVLTVSFVGVESNLVLNLSLVVSAGSNGKFTDAQSKDLQNRLGDIGRKTFPKTVAAIA
jgi:uncharacterized protein YlxP (DUF503 family)